MVGEDDWVFYGEWKLYDVKVEGTGKSEKGQEMRVSVSILPLYW